MHEKILQPPDAQSNFYPREEHHALLGALPQSPPRQKGGGDNAAQEATLEQSDVANPNQLSPFGSLITPDPESDLVMDASVTEPNVSHPALAEGSTTFSELVDGMDYGPWPGEDGLQWLQDQAAASYDQVLGSPDPEVSSSLCRTPSWQSDTWARSEQASEEGSQTALTIVPPASPKLLHTPVHLSTMLMEYWFSDVCPMWSAYDSPSNPHRQLASHAWQHSDAVFYALQSMSAICLVDSLPHIKKYVNVLSSQAIQAIQNGVRAQKQPSGGCRRTFPRELLLAIIAMGTSVCWTDPSQLGLWFLGKAHELLDDFEEDKSQLDASGRQELSYFSEALVYWEMLYRVVGTDPRDQLKKRKQIYLKRLVQAMSWDEASPASQVGRETAPSLPPSAPQTQALVIHPWTGVATNIQHTFGLVILLCRDHRAASRKHQHTTQALSDALCDIQLARDLARELTTTDLYQGEQTVNVPTGDNTTPVQHLVDTAEAYRLAALLLLCQTFPDLEMGEIVGKSPDNESAEGGYDRLTRQRHASLALAMKLVETLGRVPPESGTRCIQPILYICAGSGLRFDTSTEGSGCIGVSGIAATASSSHQVAQLDDGSLATPGRATAAVHSATLTRCTLEVSRGRRFVIDRLCALQRSLPPRPIGVALDLVRAVWTGYDYAGGQDPPHWIDIMVDKGLQTLFG